MAFNVLKDPKDPRNFIVQPNQTGPVDPNLIQQGLAAGAATGLLDRPAPPERFGERAPGSGETQFGPGSEEAFARGLFNFRGRLNRKRFEQNKRVFEANLVRDGLVMTPDVRSALDEAYKSTNGFKAAKDVADDAFFHQPEQVAQRAVDLDAQTKAEERDATQQVETIQNLKNQNEIFRVTQGVPMERYTEDKTNFNENMRLADRVRDLQTLNERVGVMRGPRFTDAERAAVQTAYDGAILELTIAVSQANKAGALTEEEFKRFSSFLPDMSATAPLQDSVRRVSLGNAFNIFKGASNDIWAGNRGLQKGSEAVNFDRDIGKPKTWEEILFLAGSKPGDIDVTNDLEAARARAAGVPETLEEVPVATQTISAPEGGRRELSGVQGAEFLEGIEDFITQGAQPEVEGETPGERLKRERRLGR